jgi:hypothetical protein
MSPDRQRTERPRSLPSVTPGSDTIRRAVILTAVCRGHLVRQGTTCPRTASGRNVRAPYRRSLLAPTQYGAPSCWRLCAADILSARGQHVPRPPADGTSALLAVGHSWRRHNRERRHVDGCVPRTCCPPGDNMSPDRQRTGRPRSLPSAAPGADTIRSAVMLTAVCRGHLVRQGTTCPRTASGRDVRAPYRRSLLAPTQYGAPSC